MRISRGLWLRLILIIVAVVFLLMRIFSPHFRSHPATGTIPDLSVTSPLNQPGGGVAPADTYEVYSALYHDPQPEPLAFAEDSQTDIPQLNGSCLKPSAPTEHQMTDAFAAANQQSHVWEKKFTIPSGYQILSQSETARAQSCVEAHGKDAANCEAYDQLRHVRFLGVPGFDRAHAHALVSVVKKCGRYCGSGGIFEVEKTGDTWRRSETSDFTRDCSWMY